MAEPAPAPDAPMGSTDDELEAWAARAAANVEAPYLAAGVGQGGSGSSDRLPGIWRAKRQHLAIPMDVDGAWLDVGCANGYLLATLPTWVAEREVTVEPHGLELVASLAELARSTYPELADRIWTGSVMAWEPPRRFRYVTALDDFVPPARLGDLVSRLLDRFVEPGGRLILSAYLERGAAPRPLAANVEAATGRPVDGQIWIDRPGRNPLITVWIDRPGP